MQPEPNISWTELAKFAGQLNHDLRNHLNAIELQAAFLGEIVAEPEGKEEVKRLREMTGEMCAHLQRLSASLGRIEPNLMGYLAAEFVEDLRAKLLLEQAELVARAEWRSSLGGETLEIDPFLLQEAFLELFCNAATHERGEGDLTFEARPAGPESGAIEFILREPKARFDRATENWGGQPLAQIRGGHYGLGLFRARGIFEAHHGTLQAEFDSAASSLITTVTLPRASGKHPPSL